MWHLWIVGAVPGAGDVVASITNDSVETLGLKPGGEACAVIKASSVILALADPPPRTSARNQFRGRVSRCIEGAVNGEVTLELADGKEWGRETELAYVVQSGTFKSLSMKWRNNTIRRDFSSNEFDENRLIFNYPLSLL